MKNINHIFDFVQNVDHIGFIFEIPQSLAYESIRLFFHTTLEMNK